jgi:hypothetical protein
VARTWLQIRVVPGSGMGEELDAPPGRVFLAGPSHSYEQLAAAINTAFARWNLPHLHLLER